MSDNVTKREARRIIRKVIKRVPEGEEIRHLNIMPMMDIMTILLVAFVFQALASTPIPLGDVQLPFSRSFDPPPEGAVMVTISKNGIVVQGEPVVGVKNGDVDSSEKKDGTLGIAIPKVTRWLGTVREVFEAEQAKKGLTPKIPELMILADKSTPYRLLFQVMVSARSEGAGYRRFRLIVLEGT
ncbi:MAG: biopolymer transporter ExbD [Deltaproteobacteria bacterium]|jgi:biopolymer transport protein ExbD|nr:biopolymer transporter ExbD [Deltaproteobacteria bacterium]